METKLKLSQDKVDCPSPEYQKEIRIKGYAYALSIYAYHMSPSADLFQKRGNDY